MWSMINENQKETHLDLVDPLHVITQLIKILDVSIADLTNNELWFAPACIWTLTRFNACLLLLSRQGRDGNTWCRST